MVWLKGINSTAADNDIFSLNLDYETQSQYNGNIGKATWQAPIGRLACDKATRSYTYSYDNASRLKQASYTGLGAENYSLPSLKFTKNGNFDELQRNGNMAGGFGMVDNLKYNYSGNRLNSITDYIAGDHNGDFVANGSGGLNYTQNGSLENDANEKIQSIEYDSYFNLVTKTTLTDGRTISHKYDGQGTLLQTIYSAGDIWDYSDGLIYKNGIPYQIAIPEGRAIYQNGNWQREYSITDQQGTVRAAFKNTNNKLEVVGLHDFDPLGNPIYTGSSNQFIDKFQFQGHEKIDGLNLINFGFRLYNPTIGIFTSPDLLAELFPGVSPMAYCLNNPVNYYDLDGMVILPAIINFSRKGRGVSLRSWNPAHKKFRAHKGVDLQTGGKTGLDVSAAAEGVVSKIGWNKNGWGRYVIINHNDGYFSLYAHLQTNGVKVQLGDFVANGESIALSGNTGKTSGPHLHLEFRKLKNGKGNFMNSDILNPYRIHDLQELIDDGIDEEEKPKSSSYQLIKPSQMSFGGNAPIKLPDFNYSGSTSNSGGWGNSLFMFINPSTTNSQPAEEKKKSESGRVPGANN